MPNTPVRAAAEGLPAINRRSFLKAAPVAVAAAALPTFMLADTDWNARVDAITAKLARLRDINPPMADALENLIHIMIDGEERRFASRAVLS